MGDSWGRVKQKMALRCMLVDVCLSVCKRAHLRSLCRSSDNDEGEERHRPTEKYPLEEKF